LKISENQYNFLISVAEKIPRLFAAIAGGNARAEFILGDRDLDGQRVRLLLVAEVIEPGGSPLSTHSKPMPQQPQSGTDAPDCDDRPNKLSR